MNKVQRASQNNRLSIRLHILVILASGFCLLSKAAEKEVSIPPSPSVEQGDGKLDFSFIQGGTGVDPSAWEAMNSNYIPGHYLLDVVVNDRKPIKQLLDITQEDRDKLCLSPDWLARAGIFIDKKYFQDTYNKTRNCYVLSAAPSVAVDMDMAAQSLTLSLPQIALSSSPENVDWDYGSTALRANYNANVNVNDVDTTTFGSLDLKGNAMDWVVTSTMSVTDSTTDVAMFTATRAIQSLQADLSAGRTFAGNDLLGSAAILGASLHSNNSMRADDLGYRPVFSGVAQSNARVSLVQSGSTLWSQPVPPGPFAIRDVTLLNSGDVEMIITEQDGSVTRQTFPLTVMQGMIAPGEHEFSVSGGKVDDNGDNDGVDGAVGAFSYGYGMGMLTMRFGSLLHQDWQGVSSELASSVGSLGGVSVSGAFAKAHYDDGQTESGAKVKSTWNKMFSATGTSVYLSVGRRLSEEYTDFTSFTPDHPGDCSGVSYDSMSPESQCLSGTDRVSKNEFNLGISQQVGSVNAGVTGWHRDYWNDESTENGLTGNLSTQVYSSTVSLGGSLSQTSGGNNDSQNNWSASLSVSIPFTAFERRYSSWTTVTTGSNQGGASITSGVSGSLNDRLSYSVGGGRSSDGSEQGTMSGSYTGDKVGIGMNINQSDGSTTGSATMTGSVLAVPAARSVILSRTVSDTVVVANIKDTSGVKFFSGMDVTDSSGNVVIPLTGYRYNTVTVDAATLPHNVELGMTSQGVVPVDQAVVYMPFDTWVVHRYLLQVRQKDGSFVPSGTWARDSQGAPLGFVAQNGVLLINAVKAPGGVSLGTCSVSADKIHDSEKLQEVLCE